MWQLYGKSGAGKSAIMSLPKLLFFGRVDTGKKGDIANRINKNGYLKGTVLKGKDTYVILRPALVYESKNTPDVPDSDSDKSQEVEVPDTKGKVIMYLVGAIMSVSAGSYCAIKARKIVLKNKI